MSLKALFAAQPDSTEFTRCPDVRWSRKDVGFGGFYFYTMNGVLHCSSECMGRDFVKKVLCDLVDAAVFDDDPKTPPSQDSRSEEGK